MNKSQVGRIDGQPFVVREWGAETKYNTTVIVTVVGDRISLMVAKRIETNQ